MDPPQREHRPGEDLPCTGDRVALVVQQVLDPQERTGLLVEPLAGGRAVGLHPELALPVAQDVRIHAHELCHFANAEVQLSGMGPVA